MPCWCTRYYSEQLFGEDMTYRTHTAQLFSSRRLYPGRGQAWPLSPQKERNLDRRGQMRAYSPTPQPRWNPCLADWTGAYRSSSQKPSAMEHFRGHRNALPLVRRRKPKARFTSSVGPFKRGAEKGRQSRDRSSPQSGLGWDPRYFPTSRLSRKISESTALQRH